MRVVGVAVRCETSGMQIEIVPCLRDNYAYLLSWEGACGAIAVDPSEAAPVLAALAGRRLTGILCTHHHFDHVGGNRELVERFPGIPVYGHAAELQGERRIPAQTHGCQDGERIELDGKRAEVLHIPGHTLTAVAYYFSVEGALFTGDTLFAAGCGRLFEGTPAQMHASLQRLLSLSPATRLYCGHEYTEKNLLFAATVEPENAAVRDAQGRAAARRAALEPSIPTTLAAEARTNPFVRTAEPGIRAAVAQRPKVLHAQLDEVEVLARLRQWKDGF